MEISPEVLAVVLAVAMGYYAAIGTIHGAKWVGHKVKRGGTAIVHVLKKPFHHDDPPAEQP